VKWELWEVYSAEINEFGRLSLYEGFDVYAMVERVVKRKASRNGVKATTGRARGTRILRWEIKELGKLSS